MSLGKLVIASGAIVGLGFTVQGASTTTRSTDSLPIDERSPASEDMVPSDSPDALLRPSDWSCDRTLPEYQEWLDQGNDPTEWKHVGKTFRDIDTDTQYTWLDWIDWINANECLPGGLVKPEIAPVAASGLPALIVPAAAAAAVAPIIFDSPG